MANGGRTHSLAVNGLTARTRARASQLRYIVGGTLMNALAGRFVRIYGSDAAFTAAILLALGLFGMTTGLWIGSGA